MSNVNSADPKLFSRLWRQLKSVWAEPVPTDVALCEFDCRKQQCQFDDWEACTRRLSNAAGELMPELPKKSVPPAA
jgi:hypothetical protein